MYISEHSFAQLRQAADERQRRELEYRRISRERAAAAGTSTGGRGLKGVLLSLRHPVSAATRRLAHP